jgi:AcrR family transcriptional regulator
MQPESEEKQQPRPPALGRPVGASGEQTRRRILDATVRCVGTVGYARATIRQIAREADMTSGPLYHYFPNKSELVKAAAEAVTQMAAPRFDQATHRHHHPVDRLVALLEESDRMIREFPHIAAFDYAIRLESPRWLNLQEASVTLYQTVLNLIGEIVASAHADGTLNEDIDVDDATKAVFALIRGLSELAATNSEEDQHRTLAAAQALIRGALFTTKTRRKR